MKGLGIGRVVHFVMSNGCHRPAIVVEVWDKDKGIVNLQVFTDGTNDFIGLDIEHYSESYCKAIETGLIWRTSVLYNPEYSPGSWHWPEFVE